jgi:hypothetical protein
MDPDLGDFLAMPSANSSMLASLVYSTT